MAKKRYKLKSGELSALCSELSMLLRAGVPLTDGLRIICGESHGKTHRAAEILSKAVENGQPLSEGMERCGAFPEHLVRMARVGETSGTVDEVFEEMAGYYEREQRLGEQVRSALVVPLILTAAMGLAICFIVARVLPMFQNILRELGGELPGVVLALLNAGRFVEKNWVLILCVFAVLAAAIVFARMTKRGRLALDAAFAKLSVCKKIAAARFAGGMGLLLGGGVALDDALDLCGDLLHNRYMQKQLTTARADMQNSNLSDVLKRAAIFPERFNRMAEVGAESGQAEVALARLADLCQTESAVALERMAGWIEPILSSVLSVIVGAILVSVIVPLIGILSLIG